MKNEKRKTRVIRAILLTLIVLTVAIACGIILYVRRVTAEELDLSLFKIESVSTQTKIYVSDEGEWVEWEEERILGERHFEYVPGEDIPWHLKSAFVAIEDKRFFDHNGVDWYRTLGAFLNYFLRFGGKFGASTITQQLIKNVTGYDEVSIERKIREIFWARELEGEMSKDEILELYLNVINLSDNCYGVGSAARRYFSKDVSELSLIECAAIAAITNNPSYYNPIRNPENNAQRRDIILTEMHEQGYISDDELSEVLGKELELCPDESVIRSEVHSWYVDMVIEDVICDLMSEKKLTRERASALVFGGGLEIYIQIDREVQTAMESYYLDASNFPSGEGAQSSMIIIDPKSGDILGVVGAIGEKSGDRIQSYATSTLRPPGSTIKPLSVYAPALERGMITYGSVYDDTPVIFNENSAGYPTPWPKNANGIYHGLSTMSYAMANSTNTIPIKILGELGLSHSFYFLRDKLHLDELILEGHDASGAFITDMDYAALALGQLNYGVSLRKISAAYTIFADGGIYHAPRSYSLVRDSRGEVLLRKEATAERVISSGNASIMTKLLSDVVWGGTANDLTLKGRVALACKTGTTQDNKDRWCIGYTPSLICGVWYGYEYPREIPRAEKNHFLNAFDSVMTEIYERGIASEYRDRKFHEDASLISVNYCMDSGLLPTDACINDARSSRVKQGFFVKGTEPTGLCTTHTLVEYDAVCGGVATVFTPERHIRRVGMIVVDREFPVQIFVSDAQFVYRELGEKIMPSFDATKPFFATLYDEKSKKYFGISATSKQFNRLSTAHLSASDLIFIRDILR